MRIAGAVIAGYMAIGILVVLTDQIFALAIPGFASLTERPLYYFAIVLFTDTLYSAAGGYLCAVIALASAYKATLALMVFGEIMGLASTIVGWHDQPHWFAIALMLFYPPAVWAGYWLRSRRRLPASADLDARA